ncbi:pseudouridylate synthase 7 homolog isoform X2 [Phoenix dactylifera]|uniref:Pseudouridylate synthase 7 homolog isoform X2 n=1 Tax=Phoenix dactylifera TaxID=42345 RepID=A0A8B8J4S9_PHODC|nr:pseudouridylate synthase 7 homolog isoform X2 [Phoenix dactylifera]
MRAIALLNRPPALAGLYSTYLLRPLRPPKPSETLAMAKSLDENDVGISCYVSSLPGFRGVLKQRYSDFIVNEVDLDEKIVHLTSFDLPPECTEVKEEENPPTSGKDCASEVESFRSLCGDHDAEALKGLLEKILSGVEGDIAPIVLSPDSDKSHRAEVHNFFKKNFKFLVTDTVEGSEGGSKCIRVRFCSVQGGGRSRRGKKRKNMGDSDLKDVMPFDSRGSDNWPENLGKFLRFHLYKENKDTQEALGVIGKMLGFQQRSFGFAGTKDKRSVSTQRVTIFKQHAERLAALNGRLFGIKVGDFCYVREGLVLGQLFGNRFTITLRGVVADSEDTIKEAANGLGRNGFINYYGLQRFGSGSVPTHLIGAALLRGEWKGAANLILDPREGERDIIREARVSYKEHGDIDLILKKLPRHLVAERAILQFLKKCPGNYLQALKAIPRTLRMMYVHSYQSYLWNHAASRRVQKYGISQVVLGDLVFCKESSAREVAAVDSSEPEDDCSDPYNCLPDTSEEAVPEEKVQSVKDGISLTESVHSAKEFSITNMRGGYRQVFQRPIDYVWGLLSYTDDTVPLAETDLDIIHKRKPADLIKEELHANGNLGSQSNDFESQGSVSNHVAQDGSEGGSLQVESICSSDAQPSKLALKLGFTLPASSYATMAIRELLKMSTSVAHQKTMNP